MAKYVKIAKDGTLGFYDSELYNKKNGLELPAGSVQISDEDYAAFFADQSQHTFNAQGKLIPKVRPKPTWEQIRNERDQKLRDTDWTQLADAPLSDIEKAQWRAYRQELRDLPQNFVRPDLAFFPTPPGDSRK